jgi:PAS domain S-box-containing protein
MVIRVMYGFSDKIGSGDEEMRKIFLLLVFSICCACAYAGEKIFLRVGLPDDPPLSFRDKQGKPKGFSVELLQCFASENDWELKFVDGTWEKCLKRLKAGEIDLLCSVVKTPRRQVLISFSKEPIYIEWGKVFVRFNQSYTSVLQLDNQVVGLVSGDVHAENFKSFIKQFKIACKYKYYDNYQASVEALEKQQIYAFVCNSVEAVKYQYSQKVRNTGVVFGAAPSYFGFPKGKFNPVIKILDAQLKSARLNYDSVYYELYRKYLGRERHPPIPQWFWYALFGASCAAVVFLIISIILRIQVNRQFRQLWEREENLRITLDSIGDAVIVADDAGEVIRMNPVAEILTGWSFKEAAGKEVCEIFKIFDAKAGNPVKSPILMVFETGKIQGLADYVTLIARNGQRRQIADSAAPIRDGNETTRGVVLVFRDVTEEYSAHEQLKENESRLRAVFDHMPVMVAAYDDEGKLAYWNSECERVLGWTSDELIGLTHGKIFQKVYPDLDYKKYRFDDIVNHRIILTSDEWDIVAKDGSVKVIIWHDVIGKADVPGWAFWSAGIEISRHKELEQQVLQMQKLESIGNLAGGVAHDFNNILQVIRGYTEMIAETAEENSEINESAKNILSSTRRGAELVRQLLFFSRQSEFSPEVVNPAELILNLLNLLKRLLGEDIRLDLDIAGTIPDIQADSNQLEQVIINICLNSRQAMPNGGNIRISAREIDISQPEQTIVEELPPGSYVVIEISDSGYGIDPAILPRIFDPFFTTGEAGQGSGLGLATVYGIIKRHNGGISVNSKPGQGSTFTLWLPVTDEPLVIKDKVPAAVGNQKIRDEFSKVILLAEDEDTVRYVAEKILLKAGYTVIPVTNGRDAVATFKAKSEDIDLLIFDIIMSEMNGPEAYRQICEIKPEFPVIFASGYGCSRLDHEELPEYATNILRKPFSRKELLSAVDKELVD